mgnify:CR=1 FL=1
MKLLTFILKLSRPRFWLYLAGPYLLGYTFAYEHSQTFITPLFLYSFFFFLIPANIFLYGVNDVNDMETDIMNPKKKSKEQTTHQQNLKTYQWCILISLLCAFPLFLLQNSTTNFFTVFFLALSYYYSAPPLRFKKRPFIDSISNILYAIPAFIGFMQIQSHFPNFYDVITIWLWTTAMHLYSAIPDIEYDKKAGIQTTAVYMGKKNSLWLCFILWFCMAVLGIFISPFFILAFVYPLGILLVITNIISPMKMYWLFPYITTLLGFLLYLYAYTT